jgi:hypothetical protein
MKATLDPSGAFANFSMNCSFSNIKAENSGVLKYGTCSPPTAQTCSLHMTGPTVKLSM